MIKKLLLLVVLPLIFMSCGSKDKTQDQLRQIDSIVNAKVRQREIENAAKNDSILRAVEAARADAIMKQRNESAKVQKANNLQSEPGDTIKY